MVKVIPCHNFTSQKIFCPKLEPSVIFCSKDLLFVATIKSTVEVYNIESAEKQWVYSFSIFGLAQQIHYSEFEDYVAVLERRVAANDSVTKRVFVYRNWRNAKIGCPVSVFRVESGNCFQKFVATETHGNSPFWDKSSSTFENSVGPTRRSNDARRQREEQRQNKESNFLQAFQIADAPQCIAVDSQTGTLAVGRDYSVALYRFYETTIAEGASLETQLKCILVFNVNCALTELSLCEEFVLFRSRRNIQIIQYCLAGTESKANRETLVLSRSPVYRKYGLHYNFVSAFLKQNPVCLAHRKSRSESKDSVQSDQVYENVSYNQNGTAASLCRCKPAKLLQNDGLGLPSDPDVINITDSANEQTYEQDGKWVFSTGHHDTSLLFTNNDTIIGPIQSHPTCPVFIVHKDPSVQLDEDMESSLLTHLYQTFQDQEVVSAQLLPLYAYQGDPRQFGDGPVRERRHCLLAVACLVTTETEGFLYLAGGARTRLIQTYSYSTHGNTQIFLNSSCLYVVNNSGVDVYSVLALAYALYEAGIKDPTLSHTDREACLVGRHMFPAIQFISANSRHLALLCMAKEDVLSGLAGGTFVEGVPAKWLLTNGSDDSYWTIYVLELPDPMTFLNDMKEVSCLHQGSSDLLYIFLLEEMYNLLRSLCVSTGGLRALEAERCVQETALALAEVSARRDRESDWKLAVIYYIMSGKSFGNILSSVSSSETPASGFWNYVDLCMFHNVDVGLEEKDMTNVIELLKSWRPTALTHAIIDSDHFMNKLTDSMLEGLRDYLCETTKHAYRTCDLDLLALCAVCCRLGDVTVLLQTLSTFSQSRITELCCVYPQLMISYSRRKLSTFALALHNVFNDALIEVFLFYIEHKIINISLLVDVFHIKGTEEELANLDQVLTHILEKLACDVKHTMFFGAILPVLLDIYLSQLLNQSKQVINLHAKYIIPKRGGLFNRRFRWLNDIHPLQGSEALTKECERSQAALQINFCPCTACNATLLKLQCLLCSTHVDSRCVQQVYDAISKHRQTSEEILCTDSIFIQCLLKLDLTKCLQFLIDNYPHQISAIIQKDVSLDYAMVLETTRHFMDTFQECTDDEVRNIYKDVLEALSALIPPREMVALLKGRMDLPTLEPFLTRSVNSYRAASLRQNIQALAESLTGTRM